MEEVVTGNHTATVVVETSRLVTIVLCQVVTWRVSDVSILEVESQKVSPVGLKEDTEPVKILLIDTLFFGVQKVNKF